MNKEEIDKIKQKEAEDMLNRLIESLQKITFAINNLDERVKILEGHTQIKEDKSYIN